MVWLFLALMVFFAWRALIYFQAGRAVAGIAASAGCLLFVAAIYVDYARATQGADSQVTAETAGPAIKREDPAAVEGNMAREREEFARNNPPQDEAMAEDEGDEGGWADEAPAE